MVADYVGYGYIGTFSKYQIEAINNKCKGKQCGGREEINFSTYNSKNVRKKHVLKWTHYWLFAPFHIINNNKYYFQSNYHRLKESTYRAYKK